MRRDFAQTIQELKEAHDRESRARLWVARSCRPPADPHELLALLKSAVALAEVDSDIVDSGHVDQSEVLVGSQRAGAAIPGWVTELDYEAESNQRSPLKESTIPFLNAGQTWRIAQDFHPPVSNVLGARHAEQQYIPDRIKTVRSKPGARI